MTFVLLSFRLVTLGEASCHVTRMLKQHVGRPAYKEKRSPPLLHISSSPTHNRHQFANHVSELPWKRIL